MSETFRGNFALYTSSMISLPWRRTPQTLHVGPSISDHFFLFHFFNLKFKDYIIIIKKMNKNLMQIDRLSFISTKLF